MCQMGMAEIETNAADFFSVFFVKAVGQCDELLKTGRNIPKDRRIFIPGLADAVFQRDPHAELRSQRHIGGEVRPIPLQRSIRPIAEVFIHHRSRMDHIIGHTAFRRQPEADPNGLIPFSSVGSAEIEGVKHRPVGKAGGHSVGKKPLREAVDIKIFVKQPLQLGKAQIHAVDPRFFHQIQK